MTNKLATIAISGYKIVDYPATKLIQNCYIAPFYTEILQFCHVVTFVKRDFFCTFVGVILRLERCIDYCLL